MQDTDDDIPLIPEEHSDLVEQAIASCDTGLSREMTAADWERLRQLARDVANRK